jgi:hypothetical protein
MKGLRALVTGATGFIGSSLSLVLLEAGAELRVMVRDKEKASELQNLGAKVFVRDLASPNDLEQALEGCDIVFHVARCRIRMESPRRPTLHQTPIWGCYCPYLDLSLLNAYQEMRLCGSYPLSLGKFTWNPSNRNTRYLPL